MAASAAGSSVSTLASSATSSVVSAAKKIVTVLRERFLAADDPSAILALDRVLDPPVGEAQLERLASKIANFGDDTVFLEELQALVKEWQEAGGTVQVAHQHAEGTGNTLVANVADSSTVTIERDAQPREEQKK
jgi:hypothetical protein